MDLVRVSLVVVYLFQVVIYPSNGYIINEEGQLVPFKIYKKGGARLHPRNCRGGFHKRLINGPGEQQQPTDNIYDLRVVKRNTRNNPNKKERETPTPIFGNDHANVFNPGFDQADAGTEMTSYVQEELKLLKEYNDKFLSEYPEQILVEVDPEQLEQNSDNDKTISLPFKQSRNSNDINDEFVPKNGLHVRDSDYRYVKSWPSYSSDSSLSIDYPKQVAHREPYSYLPDNVDDLSRTGSRTYIAGYDVTEYLPFKQRRQR